jgi:hypothetical protein
VSTRCAANGIVQRYGRALVQGAAAGAVGTATMDLVMFVRYRRGGGRQSLYTWETAEGVAKWDDASAPGQVGRMVVRAVSGRDVPDQWARTLTNVVHWATGIAWGGEYGLVLPLASVYKPIWDYDAATLVNDLTAHLAYGAAVGMEFARLAR